MGLSLSISNPYPKMGQALSEWLLQASVILLGFGMSLAIILRAMTSGALFALSVIFCTLLLGLLLGKLLGIKLRESVLISAGTAICGGAAIGAVGSVVGADEEDTTVAIGTVLLLNTAALYLFPAVGHALNLSQQQFGIWAGVAIHDVSSVVAAGDAYGLDALPIATAVKLTRVVWIMPLVLALKWALTRGARSKRSRADYRSKNAQTSKIHVPWFIGIFLLACLARQFVPGIAAAGHILSHMGIAGLTLTFFLVGAGISRKTLKALSWQAVAQGSILWLFVSAASLFVVTHWNAGSFSIRH
ncbi:MAG: putative sulfate exporter family transporter [Terriglobales bacterium]